MDWKRREKKKKKAERGQNEWVSIEMELKIEKKTITMLIFFVPRAPRYTHTLSLSLSPHAPSIIYTFYFIFNNN